MTAATVYGAPEGCDAAAARPPARRSTTAPLLHVARDDARMARLAEALAFFAPEIEVLRFPAWDCLPYDRVSPNPALVSERIATLARLLEPPTGPRIVLTTVNALVQRVPPRTCFARRQPGRCAPAAPSSRRSWPRFLEANGYGRAGTVMEPGEYAMRGGIIDIFPAGEADPVRLDLFGDTIESIRRFDPATQRSAGKRAAAGAAPGLRGAARRATAIARFRTGWRELFGPAAAQRPDLPVDLRRAAASRHGALGAAVPRAHGDAARLPAGRLGQPRPPGRRGAGRAAGDDRRPLRRRAQALPRDGEVPYRPLPPDRLYLDRAGWDAMLARRPAVRLQPVRQAGRRGGHRWRRPARAGVRPGRRRPGVNVFDQLREQAERWARRGAAHRRRRLDRAARASGSPHLLREHGFKDVEPAETGPRSRRMPARHRSALVTLGLERGFVAERLGAGRRAGPAGRAHQPPAAPAQARRPVHRRSHRDRRGRSGGAPGPRHRPLRRAGDAARSAGAPHDCLRLIYDGDDKLFLPVENIEMLSRFGSESAGRRRSTSWAAPAGRRARRG